jgi:hypothetical protein
MLAFKDKGQHTFVHFSPGRIDSRQVLRRLRSSSLSDLVLPTDASLSLDLGEAPDAEVQAHFPDLGLTADDENLQEVSLTVLGWEFDDYKEFPDASRWGRELDLSFWYGLPGQGARAKQSFAMQGFDRKGLPSISRSVWAADYAETGYEGHNQMYRSCRNEREAHFFIELMAELFALTPQGKESPPPKLASVDKVD